MAQLKPTRDAGADTRYEELVPEDSQLVAELRLAFAELFELPNSLFCGICCK